MDPLRIFYLGNTQGFVNGAKYYFTPQKLINGFTRLGHNVYNFCDRDYARYTNIFHSQKLGMKKMNRKVIEMCAEYKPDLIVLGHCKNVSNDTLQACRDILPNVKILYRNVDPLHSQQNLGDIRQRVGHVDSMFITTAGDVLKQFSHPKTKVAFMPNPVDRAVEYKRAFENKDAEIDFLFLASYLRDQHDHRHILAKKLIAQLGDKINLHIGGAGINDNKIFGAEYYDTLGRSKMGLCMNKTEEFYLYASGRMSQYMASGVLAFIPEGPQFEDVLGTDSFISFSEDDELIEKILYYLEHDEERKRIAQTGWHKVHDYFNVDKVCQFMIETTYDLNFSQDYKWPTTRY